MPCLVAIVDSHAHHIVHYTYISINCLLLLLLTVSIYQWLVNYSFLLQVYRVELHQSKSYNLHWTW